MHYLEELGLLDPNNDVCIYALHFIYIPRRNHALTEFKEGWNNHGIRTEQGQSPHQLYVAGALRLQLSGLTALDFFEDVDGQYGIEEEGLAASEESNAVSVPVVRFGLIDEDLHQLQHEVIPLADSQNYGIDLYERTVNFIQHVVSQNQQMYV